MGAHSSVDPSSSAFGRQVLQMMGRQYMVMAKAKVDVACRLLELRGREVGKQRAFPRDLIGASLQKKKDSFPCP